MVKDNDEILPLVLKAHTSEKHCTSIFNIPSNPKEVTSVKYDFLINNIRGDEPLRKGLNFKANIIKLCVGLDLVSNDKMEIFLPMVLCLMYGSSLDALNQGFKPTYTALWVTDQQTVYRRHIVSNASNVKNPTNINNAAELTAGGAVPKPAPTQECVDQGLNNVISSMAPFRVLARVKRYLRRNCRKPDDTKICQYISNFVRINTDELKELPPFQANQELLTSEVIEIFQFAIPNSWSRKMQEQGFDHVLHIITEFVEKAEQLEESEANEELHRKNTPVHNKDTPSGQKSARFNNNVKDKYCIHHGKNSTHTTEQYKVLMNQRNSRNNKLLTNKSSDNTNKLKQDLDDFISKTIRKEMNAFNGKKRKKRKSEANRAEIKNDDYQVNKGNDDDIKDFDYNCLNNLSLEDISIPGDNWKNGPDGIVTCNSKNPRSLVIEDSNYAGMYNINECRISRLVVKLIQYLETPKSSVYSIPDHSSTFYLKNNDSQYLLGAAIYHNNWLTAVNSHLTYRRKAKPPNSVPIPVRSDGPHANHLIKDLSDSTLAEAIDQLLLQTIRTLDTPRRVPLFLEPVQNEQIWVVYAPTQSQLLAYILSHEDSFNTFNVRDAFFNVPISYQQHPMGVATIPIMHLPNQFETVYIDDVMISEVPTPMGITNSPDAAMYLADNTRIIHTPYVDNVMVRAVADTEKASIPSDIPNGPSDRK